MITGNEFGTISPAGKDANGNVAVELDQGSALHLKADHVVLWEAHLNSGMPVPEYGGPGNRPGSGAAPLDSGTVSSPTSVPRMLRSKPSNEWRDAQWIKQGAKAALSSAAVRFADGAAPSENRYHEERFVLLEGETNADTIIGENFDEQAW